MYSFECFFSWWFQKLQKVLLFWKDKSIICTKQQCGELSLQQNDNFRKPSAFCECGKELNFVLTTPWCYRLSRHFQGHIQRVSYWTSAFSTIIRRNMCKLKLLHVCLAIIYIHDFSLQTPTKKPALQHQQRIWRNNN